MNRTIKEATVKLYYYETHQQLKEYLNLFLAAYSFARRLKTLNGQQLTNTSSNVGKMTENDLRFIRITTFWD